MKGCEIVFEDHDMFPTGPARSLKPTMLGSAAC
jgi:hypothetical protein